MTKTKLIEQIDVERLYQHILNIEGVRHPIDNPDLLDAVADYIRYEFEMYGLIVTEQIFQIDGFEQKFRNIEGFLDRGSDKELLVTAHYDTVSISPGANDNGSGIAGMLEIARVIVKTDIETNVRFIAFTLEEGHPQQEKKIRALMEESDLVDDELRFSTYHSIKLLEILDVLREEYLAKGKTVKETWQLAIGDIAEQLTDKERQYIDSLQELYENVTRTNWVGESICIGSSMWLEKNKHNKQNILGVFNLEEIGYSSEKKYSQQYPTGIDPERYPSYKVDIENRVGNFVGIFADKYSKSIAQAFCTQCKKNDIELPFHSLEVPLNYEEISLQIIDLLRSDHSPFWKENIPAISITDTFEFRYPYYHTSADISDYLDFEFMTKIVQATLATIIALA